MAHNLNDLDSGGKTDATARGEHADTASNGRSTPRGSLLAGIALVVAVAIVLVLVLRASGANGTKKSAAIPTATSAPNTLYQSDWSHGTDGWTLTPHWSIVNGQLVSDGHGGTDPLLTPYYVTAKNYTITVNLTVLSIPNYYACHTYGIEGLDGNKVAQWVGEIQCIRQQGHAGFSEIYVAHADSMNDSLFQEDFSVTANPQADIVVVQDKNVDYCPEQACLPNLNSTAPLAPVHIALLAIGVQLTISSITITTP